MGKEEEAIFIPGLGRGGGSTSSKARATFPDLLPVLSPPHHAGHGEGDHDPARNIRALETDHRPA